MLELTQGTESRKKSGGDAAILLCAGVTKEMREQILGLAVNLEIAWGKALSGPRLGDYRKTTWGAAAQ